MIVGHVDDDRAGDRSTQTGERRIVEDQIEGSIVSEVGFEDYCPVCDGTRLVNCVGAVAQWIPSLDQLMMILSQR